MYKQMMNMDEKKREEIEMKTTNPKARRSMNWRRRALAQRRRRSSRQTDRQTDGDSKGIAVLTSSLHTNFSVWRWS
jgi:hypothetical protein